MVPPGDEVQKRARPDDVGYCQSQIEHNREHRGIDKAEPERFAGCFQGQSGDGLTQLE
jgi:hypothetical protein